MSKTATCFDLGYVILKLTTIPKTHTGDDGSEIKLNTQVFLTICTLYSPLGGYGIVSLKMIYPKSKIVTFLDT